MNGWVKKNVAVIINIIVILVGLSIVGSTVKADVGYMREEIVKVQVKDSDQDSTLANIERSLGTIEGKVDIIVKEMHSHD